MRHILRAIAFTLIPVIGLCNPMGLAHLDRMIRDAKLIVVARVAEGGQSGKLASVTLEVQRTLKGQAPSGMVSASLEVSEQDSATRNLKGWQGIWFLSEDGRLLPAVSGSVLLGLSILPALPNLPASWAGPDSASPTEKVLRELSAALETNPAFPLLAEVVSQSSTEPASTLRSVYRRMQASSSQVVSAAGLAGLLRSGDVQGLEGLTAQLARGPLPAGGPLMGQAVCQYLNGNPRGLPILAGFAAAASPIPLLRGCAAFALRNIHSKESIPFLIGLLDSDDLNVRYEGIAGLASYANSGLFPGEKPLMVDDVVQSRIAKPLLTPATAANFPTLDTFRRDEVSFISFWRGWVRESIAAAAP